MPSVVSLAESTTPNCSSCVMTSCPAGWYTTTRMVSDVTPRAVLPPLSENVSPPLDTHGFSPPQTGTQGGAYVEGNLTRANFRSVSLNLRSKSHRSPQS